MNHRCLRILAVLFAAILCCAAKAAEKPNIIFIMVDDHDENDVGTIA